MSDCLGGSEFVCGQSANQHNLAPVGSGYPMRMALFSGEKNVTSVLENLTVELASKIVPRPTNVCSKDGMMQPLVGNALIVWGMCRSAMASDCTMWPLAVPTYT